MGHTFVSFFRDTHAFIHEILIYFMTLANQFSKAMYRQYTLVLWLTRWQE